jgi:hypothetical protein
MSSERVHYRVLSDGGMWKVERDGDFFGQYRTQESAIAAAVGAARTEHKAGNLTQLTISETDGKIRTEWTYGDDPHDIPG